MLNEIRSFFEEARKQPAPTWPEGAPAISPATGEDLRAVSELHWRLGMECLDDLEIRVVELYEAGADEPALIDLMDEVVAIIRRKIGPAERIREIGQLLQKSGRQIARK